MTGRTIAEASRQPSPKVSEAVLQTQVIHLAKFRGWRVMHSRPALNRSGRWSTPIQGHKGFPDLVLARSGVVLFVELKAKTGRLSPDQTQWLDELAGPDTYVFVWRPADWDEIERILHHGPARNDGLGRTRDDQ